MGFSLLLMTALGVSVLIGMSKPPLPGEPSMRDMGWVFVPIFGVWTVGPVARYLVMRLGRDRSGTYSGP